VDEGLPGNFYNAETLHGTLVGDQAWQASWNITVAASATAAVAPIPTGATDFRADLPEIVAVLVLQGDADQVLPLDKTGRRLAVRLPTQGLTPPMRGCGRWRRTAARLALRRSRAMRPVSAGGNRSCPEGRTGTRA
jgi:hypothetical protein